MMDFETMVYSMDLTSCPWTLTMASVHGCPCISMFYQMAPWSETMDSLTMVRVHGMSKHDLVHGLHRVIHGLYPWSVCMYVHGDPCFITWNHGLVHGL